MNHTAPVWLPGGQTQTIWPALFSRRANGAMPRFVRERWTTPDQDFIDVDWLQPAVATPTQNAPLLVQFHGLEGSSQSHYAQAFADVARQHGWAYAVPHFRGCSGELNLAPRAYHSGDFEEVDWILRRFRAWQDQRGGGPMLVVGVSLGGNALMRWAAEAGDAAAAVATGRRLPWWQCTDALGGRGWRSRCYGGHGCGRRVFAAGPRCRRVRHWPRVQSAGLQPHVPEQHAA
jgi:uncharacterized protein